MTNLITDSITTQLGDCFGANYCYYIEEVRQGLQKPCFLIETITPRMRSCSPTRYERTVPIVVSFYNENEEYVKQDNTIAEQIIECLEYLNVGDALIRAEDISTDFESDVLKVFLTYRFTTEKVLESDDDNMEILVLQ